MPKPLRESTQDYLLKQAAIMRRLAETGPPNRPKDLSHLGGLHRPTSPRNEPTYTAPPEQHKPTPPPAQHKPTPPLGHKPPGAYPGHVPYQSRPDVEHGVCDHCHKGGPLTVTHDEKTVCWRGVHGKGGCHNRQRFTPPPSPSGPPRRSAWDEVE
jgi:hypothetical protein